VGTRYHSYVCLLLLSIIVNQLAARASADDARPNLLLILVDDLGYGDLGSYGAEDLDSPHIDKLVKQGMKWTQFYANCPVCSPTRAALLSGQYPDAVGVPGVIRTHAQHSFGYLCPDVELLPAVLARARYRTAMIGKWHLGLGSPNLPNQRGFHFFHGFLGDMMNDYYNHLRHGFNYMRLNGDEIHPPEVHATDLFTQWACDWLKAYDSDSPFFMYVAYNAPHSPIQPPQEHLDRYHARHPDVGDQRAGLAAFVEHLDAGVGAVLAALDETGHTDNTLVIFTSDNGGAGYFGADNGPLAGQKQDMLEGGIRIPMCARWPGKIAAGTANDRVALTMDLFPTLCQAAGAEWSEDIDGRSILPTLLGESQPPEERFLFWVRLEGGKRYQGKRYYCVRQGPWKLLQNDASEPLRLVHLENDPQEVTDLIDSNRPVTERLRRALEEHKAACASVPFRDEHGRGPNEVVE
jgi:arylsulfatase A-like enzyme